MPPIASALSNLATALSPRKGEMTRAAIVEAAMGIAARDGLEGLTIGTLADQMQMSKSGVFAHFGSREDLQLAVLKEYVQRFVDDVLRPAVKKPRGLPRLEALLERWVTFLAREISTNTYLNLMDQYQPFHRACEFPEISRPTRSSEYREALAIAARHGLARLDRPRRYVPSRQEAR